MATQRGGSMEDFLNQMIAEVSRQRQVLEIECGLLKGLLKPWPRKKIELEDSENEQQKLLQIQEVHKVSDNFSHEEKQALTLVDKLLRKAEKARQVNSKIRRDLDERTALNICNNNKIYLNDIHKSKSLDDEFSTNSSTSIRTLDTKSNHHESTTPKVPTPTSDSSSKQNYNVSSSYLENSLAKNQYADIKKNGSSVIMKINKDIKQKSYRPPSTHKPSSGKTCHVPAHMLAPFKTSDNKGFPKHAKSHPLRHNSSTIVAVKANAFKDNKTYKTIHSIACGDNKRSQISDTNTSSVGHSSNSKIDSTKSSSSASSLINRDCPGEMRFADRLHQQNSTPDTNSNYSAISNFKNILDHSPRTSNCHSDSLKRYQSPKTLPESYSDLPSSEFSLQKHGKSLKLPSKLVKLVTVNRSLRNRLSTSRPVKILSAANPAQKFVDRLCAQEEISEELRTRVSALTCLRSHHILLDMLHRLQLDKISESTLMEMMYRAKRIVEFVLTAFTELQQEADNFSKAKYRRLPPVPDMYISQRDQLMTPWLFTDLHLDIQDDLWNHLQTSKLWAHKQFTEKYLQLNILLITKAEEEWWKILKSQDRDPSVLQGVYGLLTSIGQFLPALVEHPQSK